MRGRIGKLLGAALLLALLPTALAAEPKEAPPAGQVKAAEPKETPPAGEATAEEPKQLEGYTGVVQKVLSDGIVVKRWGTSTDPRALLTVKFAGGFGVPVSGQGKNSWLALRRGDLVLVSYEKGPPAQVRKVNVLPKPTHPALRKTKTKAEHRKFIGYIKRREGDELIVMHPPAADPRKRPAEIKAFIRHESTSVELLRDSWEDLKKGDRVQIAFQKGNPRPVDWIQVIWRGGEKPLPPGTATRLFDPDYDTSVKDVDGIGETGPVPKNVKSWPAGKQRVKVPGKR